MQEILQNQAPREKARPSPLTILAGVLVLATLAAVAWLTMRTPEGNPSNAGQANLPVNMSAEEAAYAKNMRIENIALSRAENFIHQEVTILAADAVNAGSQPVEALSVSVEFFDDLHQVVLRESRGVLGTPAARLGPGQTRNFQISFDRVPPTWNLQQPAVQVSYLRLGAVK